METTHTPVITLHANRLRLIAEDIANEANLLSPNNPNLGPAAYRLRDLAEQLNYVADSLELTQS